MHHEDPNDCVNTHVHAWEIGKCLRFLLLPPALKTLPRVPPPSGQITQWVPQLGLNPIPKQLPTSTLQPSQWLPWGSFLPPPYVPEPPACLLCDLFTLVITPSTPCSYTLGTTKAGTYPSLLFIYMHREEPNKCLVSDIRMNNKETIRGTLDGKGPLRSAGPFSYPTPKCPRLDTSAAGAATPIQGSSHPPSCEELVASLG